MSVRPLFKGFALTFILYNCRKRDYIMPVNDDKVKLYGELAKIDPFEFWDTNLIPENFTDVR